ncbi:ABC transporter substrate-binding protein [Rhizobium sp. Leaf383]|uniref:ABC transporter substrate-binding protein n=1 Tax=Rhizobium sp. Leaf383 TaxID=1736357 RepID=UPI0009E8DC52|nr:ABC transporter substrate-binding protein [Rhizobium sp. Leaf383]
MPYSSDVGSFDPDNSFEVGALGAINAVYEGLVEYSPDSIDPVGLLADRWETSADARTYTFKLHAGVKFHDGTPMNASAVRESFLRRMRPNQALSYFLHNVESMEAVDESTFVVTLKKPQANFLHLLASPWGPKVVSAAAMKDHTFDTGQEGWFIDHACGTGPYRLASFRRQIGYTLQRNDGYWGKKPSFPTIDLPVVPDMSQQILQAKSGSLDLIAKDYPIAQLPGLDRKFAVTTGPGTAQYTLFIKPGTALEEPSVRKAVMTAIDPSGWVGDVFGPYATASTSLFPKTILVPGEPIRFSGNLEAARQTIVDRGVPALSIGLQSSSITYARIADLLIAQLSTIGIEATAYPLPPGAAYQLRTNPQAPDLLLTVASPDAADPESQLRAFYTADAPLNFFGKEVPEADAILDEATANPDVADRNRQYETAARMYFDAGAAIPLVDADSVVVHRADLTDLGLRPIFPPGYVDFGSIRVRDQ